MEQDFAKAGKVGADVAHLESIVYTGFSDEEAAILRAYEGKRGKQVIRKIDRHVIPVLGLLYLFSHVGRSNLSNAKIKGMGRDLNLVGNQYNIASSLFFVPYIIFEEKQYLDLRCRQSGNWPSTGEEDRFSWSLLLNTMLDWKILLGALMGMINAAPNAAFSYTMPTIIKKLSFESQDAQLLTIPPYFCGAVSS
ncbi:hypothetical protein BO83DRAFT_430498 [Aspergillus eucalypticola CBS 122712]|uniref:MFS general substrate transporter n=1 Tax=Aspergillus eucalypticola (strain CBS 122712 / IBT 29274) TaxID=1448314 RepID=A0A317UVR8_ASPEC|nr:uncharacterized protein BO83DRAFT_430498 [Aspergillus eucalypticola CBS 122712]PWY65499.1 hypothetical protein BO83DRAFT_430498 [Aspergillus eucalypticola CBS 122712]